MRYIRRGAFHWSVGSGEKGGYGEAAFGGREAEPPETARQVLIFDSMSRLRHERVEHCRGFKAEVLDQNRRALHVFTRAAKTAKTEYDEGVYTTSYRLDDE